MKKKNGFTLVELVVTILILGIITLIAIPVVSIQLKNSRRDSFKMTCDNIFSLNEKYELVQELLGDDTECAVFDFEKDIEEPTEIDGVLYQPIKNLGLENTSDLKGQYKLCKGKQLVVKNEEFTCVYDTNNAKLLDTTKAVAIPVLTSVEVVPYDDQILVITHTENEIKNYYYKLDDSDFIKDKNNTYTFKNLTPSTDYKITVYVEDKNGIKSNEIVVNTTTAVGYTGIPNSDYDEGDTVSYGGVEFLVVKDNGDTVTLITKYNVKVDKFGNTSSWNDSSAKSYLNSEWLNNHETIKTDVEKDAVIYNTDSQSYIRMIQINELSSKIPNASNTPFWTMTSNGSNVKYALKNASSTYQKYTLNNDTEKTIYLGSGEKLESITNKYVVNTTTSKTTSLETLPTKTQVLTGNKKNKTTLATGYDSYNVTQVEEDYNCNCTQEDCDFGEYECLVTSTSTSTVYGSYCTGNKCIGDACAWSTCTGNVCKGYASTSCGRHSCGKYKCTLSSCNTYNKGKSNQDVVCGPNVTSCTNYCIDYCQGGCTTEACGGSACAGWRCTQEACAGSSTTVKSIDTIYNTETSTCTGYRSKCEKCETCTKETDFYEASGSQVTCERYTVSETTDVIGIRAVLTVKKQRKAN